MIQVIIKTVILVSLFLVGSLSLLAFVAVLDVYRPTYQIQVVVPDGYAGKLVLAANEGSDNTITVDRQNRLVILDYSQVKIIRNKNLAKYFRGYLLSARYESGQIIEELDLNSFKQAKQQPATEAKYIMMSGTFGLNYNFFTVGTIEELEKLFEHSFYDAVAIQDGIPEGYVPRRIE